VVLFERYTVKSSDQITHSIFKICINIGHYEFLVCTDEMLTAGSGVLSPSSDDIPSGDLPKIFTPTGGSTTTDNPTPTVVFTLDETNPSRVTEVNVKVTNGDEVNVELSKPNGEKTTKVCI
jgi:hypothetical protein